MSLTQGINRQQGAPVLQMHRKKGCSAKHKLISCPCSQHTDFRSALIVLHFKWYQRQANWSGYTTKNVGLQPYQANHVCFICRLLGIVRCLKETFIQTHHFNDWQNKIGFLWWKQASKPVLPYSQCEGVHCVPSGSGPQGKQSALIICLLSLYFKSLWIKKQKSAE